MPEERLIMWLPTDKGIGYWCVRYASKAALRTDFEKAFTPAADAYEEDVRATSSWYQGRPSPQPGDSDDEFVAWCNRQPQLHGILTVEFGGHQLPLKPLVNGGNRRLPDILTPEEWFDRIHAIQVEAEPPVAAPTP